jgi:chloride channel 3/4/5
MGGTELVYTLFSECRKGAHSSLCVLDPSTFSNIWPVIRAILVAMVVKAGLTVVTFGIKVPAGIFIPSLGVGACAGRVLGIIMRWLQYQIPESKLFQACQGDLDCEHLYSIVFRAI